MGRVIQLFREARGCDGYCDSGRLPCTCRPERAADVIAERAAMRRSCAHPPKARGAHRLYLQTKAAVLRLRIWGSETYLKRCKPDGLIFSLDVAAFRAEVQTLRVRLASVERRL